MSRKNRTGGVPAATPAGRAAAVQTAPAYSIDCGMHRRSGGFACGARYGAGRYRVLRQMGHSGDGRRYKGKRGYIQLLFQQGVCGDILCILHDRR